MSSERLVEAIYSEAQAAVILRMTPRMLADRRRAGKIRCIKDGRFVAYTVEHFAEYLRVWERKPGDLEILTSTSNLLAAVKDHLEKVTPRGVRRKV